VSLAHRTDSIGGTYPIVEILGVEVGKWVEQADVEWL
jgi:hypothetical protein